MIAHCLLCLAAGAAGAAVVLVTAAIVRCWNYEPPADTCEHGETANCIACFQRAYNDDCGRVALQRVNADMLSVEVEARCGHCEWRYQGLILTVLELGRHHQDANAGHGVHVFLAQEVPA